MNQQSQKAPPLDFPGLVQIPSLDNKDLECIKSALDYLEEDHCDNLLPNPLRPLPRNHDSCWGQRQLLVRIAAASNAEASEALQGYCAGLFALNGRTWDYLVENSWTLTVFVLARAVSEGHLKPSDGEAITALAVHWRALGGADWPECR